MWSGKRPVICADSTGRKTGLPRSSSLTLHRTCEYAVRSVSFSSVIGYCKASEEELLLLHADRILDLSVRTWCVQAAFHAERIYFGSFPYISCRPLWLRYFTFVVFDPFRLPQFDGGRFKPLRMKTTAARNVAKLVNRPVKEDCNEA